jgi:hypothetical protein
MKHFWHTTGHVLAQVGLGAIQVANVTWFALPPPFNVVVAGGAGVASIIIAKTHKQPIPITAPVTAP